MIWESKLDDKLALFVYVIFLLNEKRRVVMIEYAIEIHSNKKKKEKVNCYFSLDFTEFIWIL